MVSAQKHFPKSVSQLHLLLLRINIELAEAMDEYCKNNIMNLEVGDCFIVTKGRLFNKPLNNEMTIRVIHDNNCEGEDWKKEYKEDKGDNNNSKTEVINDRSDEGLIFQVAHVICDTVACEIVAHTKKFKHSNDEIGKRLMFDLKHIEVMTVDETFVNYFKEHNQKLAKGKDF